MTDFGKAAHTLLFARAFDMEPAAAVEKMYRGNRLLTGMIAKGNVDPHDTTLDVYSPRSIAAEFADKNRAAGCSASFLTFARLLSCSFRSSRTARP